MNIKKAVLDELERQGMPKSGLARLMGVTRQGLDSALRSPNLATLTKMANALSIRPSTLLALAEEL